MQKGKTKVFELGQFTRQRYEAFLPGLYNETWFKAYSTKEDATLTSSQSYLAAFFWPKPEEKFNPDLPWQPVPVHIAPEEILSLKPNCPSYIAELDEVVGTDPLLRAFNEEYAQVYEYITKHTGLECSLGFKALRVYDNIHIENHHKLELPAWTKSIYPQPLSFIAETSFKVLTHTDQMKRICEYSNSIKSSYLDAVSFR